MMLFHRLLSHVVIVLSVTTLTAVAQQAAPPQPILRATLSPPRTVVGQSVILTLDVLAPNFLTAPPVVPEFQIRNAVTRPSGRVNLSEQRNGMTYAGVRFSFAIFPQEPGSYAIANQTVAVAYAADPPKTSNATLAVPRLTFEAFVPDAAQGLDPFIAATRLSVQQAIDRSSAHLKVGDAVVRTITLQAEGTPAMLLPPTRFAAFDGLSVYPDQPSLQDKADPRSDALTATRIDRATYMLERPGDYLLPAIEVAWWNVRDQKVERAQVDPVALHVAANPALAQGTSAVPSGRRSWHASLDRLLDHWPLIALLLAILAAIAWMTPRAIQALCHWNERRREAYRASEACAFARVRSAARRGDASRTYADLVAWLERVGSLAPDHTVAALRRAARDPILDRQIAALEQSLFAPGATGGAVAWSPQTLLRRLTAARRHLQREKAVNTYQRSDLETAINPTARRVAASWLARPVAR